MTDINDVDLVGDKTGAYMDMFRVGRGLLKEEMNQILLLTSNAPTAAGTAGSVTNAATTIDGGGMAFSNQRSVDNFEATRFAEIWKDLGAYLTTIEDARRPVEFGATNFNQVSQKFVFDKDTTVGNVEFLLGVSGINPAFLQIKLVSPSGTTINLTDPKAPWNPGSSSDYQFSLDSTVFQGESSKGSWEMVATYYGPLRSPLYENLKSPLMIVSGADATRDIYHFTNEFLKTLASDPSRGTINDTDGGVDWINLASQTGDVRLDLKGGAQTSVDGQTMFRILPVESVKIEGDARTIIIDTIENAVTGDGNDTLFGNSLDNHLKGMRGNDKFVSDAGADILDGGEGIDTVTYAGSMAVDIDLYRGAQYGGHAQGDQLVGIENVTGSAYADKILGNYADNTLTGLDGNDVLSGMEGDDRLDGGAGDDLLIGGTGADKLIGGDGFDTVSYADSSARVILNLSTGVHSSGDAEGDTFTSVEAFVGSTFNDRFTGSALADKFSGGAGDDVIVGSEGADIVDGGSGYDAMLYTLSKAGVKVDLGLGTASGGQAEGDQITGIEDLKGSKYADILIGNGAKNDLNGGAGDDVLGGGGGTDTLTGGTGDDTLTGGTAADTFVFDSFGFGKDVITDFSHVAGDKIDLSGLGIDFSDIVITATTRGDMLTFGGSVTDSILLAGHKGGMSASDFDFI